MRLSHSAVQKYLSCPKSYQYHYEQKYREKTTTSALLFGSAMDEALNQLLLDHKKGELGLADHYHHAFDKAWLHGKINGKEYYLPECTILGYSTSDFDHELLTEEDRTVLKGRCQELVPNLPWGLPEIYTTLSSYKDQKASREWSEPERMALSLFNWRCLRRKGHLMIDAYLREVVPNIKEVVDVQVKVDASNGQDSIIGFIDAIITWKDGRTFPIDNKTAASEYAEHVMATSQQLGLYGELTGYSEAGYFVMLKQITKNRVKICSKCFFDGSGGRHKNCPNELQDGRCKGEWMETIQPEARVQIIIDKITQNLKNNVIESFDDVARGIRAGVFPRNLSACVKPWGRCAFYGICHQNDFSDVEKMDG